MPRLSNALAGGIAATLLAFCSELRAEGPPPSTQTTLEAAEKAGAAPTAAELQLFMGEWWPSFSRLIQQQDRLIDAPSRLIRLPQALCRWEMAQTYECASLIEYQLTNGTQRSALLRYHVARDAEGRLHSVIYIRETPTPQSNHGVR